MEKLERELEAWVSGWNISLSHSEVALVAELPENVASTCAIVVVDLENPGLMTPR